jgi:hypothetical protein
MDEGVQSISVMSDRTTFSESKNGWEADFTDYPASAADSVKYRLQIAYTMLPASAGLGNSIMMSGTNNSNGNLFMFMKKKIAGLRPNTQYATVFDVEFATSVVSGTAAAENVFLKAGAVAFEPKNNVYGSEYNLNIDKGNGYNSGADMIVLGNIAKTDKSSSSLFTRTIRSNAETNSPFIVKSNADGELWLLVGTESAYDGNTTLYYTHVNVVLSATN